MTAAQAKAIIDAAVTLDPEPPRPLRRVLPPAEPFPEDALGGVLSAAARAIRERVQAPVAICAQSVLAASTLAAQSNADVQLPTGQNRPLSGYFITVGATGERKTSTDNEALRPVWKHEENLRAQYKADLPAYQNAADAWQKQRDQILSDKGKYGDQDAKRQALDALGNGPTPPLHPMKVCPEPTMEGLERLLLHGQPSMGIFSGEGGQFIGGHGMREEAKLRTATSLSSVWDGAPIKRVRAGDGATILVGRRVSVHLMVQPDVANILLSDRLLENQGFLSRLLTVAPESTAGTRLWREPAAGAEADLRRYGARLLDLLERAPRLAGGKANELDPPALDLATAARPLWIAFADHVECEIRPDGTLAPVRGLANKLAEHAARIAGVLTMIQDAGATEISVAQMEAGIHLAQHYADEALRLFDSGHVSPGIANAERLLGWLLAREEPLISLPDIYQLGPNAIRDKRTAQVVVGVLEDHGWLSRVDGGAIVRNVRRCDVWRVWGRPQ